MEGISSEGSYNFTVIPLDGNSVIIKNWNPENKDKEIKIALNKLTSTPVGKILITPSKYYKRIIMG